MAIIYSYPEIPDVQGGDLLLISDTGAPNKPTRSVDIDDLAAYIGTVVGVVQNLQSVLTVGNTYVSPDGYGTFTLDVLTASNAGNIKYLNTDENWGYFLNAEEGLFFTDGTGGQTGGTGIGLGYVTIGNSNHIGKIWSANITANRTYQLPNASGTIALENVSEWYNVTGSRGLGNLLVKIGDYDNSGNGTFLSIDDADESMIFTKGGVVENKFVFAATQDRDYTFPNADGTIALTSDIPAPGPSGSGTTNYTARWTNASTLGIGALYDNGNYVGIGTNNPINKLHVYNGITRLDSGSASSNALSVNSNFSNTAINLFANSGSGFISVNSSGMNLGAPWNGGAKVSILNNGNVGIGTTSPSEKLEVDGNAIVSGIGVGTTTVYSNSINLNNSGTVRIGNAEFLSKSSNDLSIYQAKISIQQGGNVGIGTTAPTTKLHVVGNARVTGAYYDSNNSPGTAGKVLSSTGAATSWIEPSSVITRLIPYFQTATPGGSDTYTQSNNVVDFNWSGGSGTYEYILPSATAIPYRTIRFVNDSTITASDKIHITAPSGETIDGGAFYEINKPYNGCAVWSDGVQWIVIQAKA